MRLLDNLFYVRNLEVSEKGEAHAVLTPNCSHVIYKAHFPNSPITPGVCLLEMVTELVGDVWGGGLRLKEVANLKFLNVLVPYEGCEIMCDMRYDNATHGVQAEVRKSETVYAKMSLRFELE